MFRYVQCVKCEKAWYFLELGLRTWASCQHAVLYLDGPPPLCCWCGYQSEVPNSSPDVESGVQMPEFRLMTELGGKVWKKSSAVTTQSRFPKGKRKQWGIWILVSPTENEHTVELEIQLAWPARTVDGRS